MEYMTQAELTRLMNVARQENELHWQAMLTAFYFGLRVSELINILGEDVQDGQLRVRRLKRSETTLQRIPDTKGSPAFELRLSDLAQKAGPRCRIFPISRQRCDQFMKRYCRLAGIHRAKAHLHTMKHSIAMAIWYRTHQPGQIKAYLGHKSMSSTMQYLNESDSLQAQEAVSALAF
jgi:integrase